MTAPERHWGWAPAEQGAPAPEGTEPAQRVSGAERVSSSCDRTPSIAAVGAASMAKPAGRPKQFDGKLRVPMTVEQREAVDRLAQAGGCSAAEAVRRLIDGTEVPAARPDGCMDPEQYRGVIDAIGGIRTELNIAGGNWYRLVRDHYGGQVSGFSELAGVRNDIQRGLHRLIDLERHLSRWSPW